MISDKYAVEVLHSYLAGDTWKEALDYALTIEETSWNDNNLSDNKAFKDGTTFTISQHNSFQRIQIFAEDIISTRLEALGIARSRFYKIFESRVANESNNNTNNNSDNNNTKLIKLSPPLQHNDNSDIDNTAVVLVIQEFQPLLEFSLFNDMMIKRVKQKRKIQVNKQIESKLQIFEQEANPRKKQNYFFLFWDIENINIPKKINASQLFVTIKEMIKEKGFIDDDSMIRTSCYHNPRSHSSAVNKNAIRDLIRSCVRVVDIGNSKKSERADKLISDDISNVLYDFPDVTKTSIGIITNDCDFTNDLKRIKDYGFKSIIIHREKEGGASTLASFATDSIFWEDIINKVKMKMPINNLISNDPNMKNINNTTKTMKKNRDEHPQQKQNHMESPRNLKNNNNTKTMKKNKDEQHQQKENHMQISRSSRSKNINANSRENNIKIKNVGRIHGEKMEYINLIPEKIISPHKNHFKQQQRQSQKKQNLAQEIVSDTYEMDNADNENVSDDDGDTAKYEIGVVSVWKKSGYGFISTKLKGKKKKNRKKYKDIYVHNTSLVCPGGRRRFLKKGERVQYIVGKNNRGPIAIRVEGVNGKPLYCTTVTDKENDDDNDDRLHSQMKK